MSPVSPLSSELLKKDKHKQHDSEATYNRGARWEISIIRNRHTDKTRNKLPILVDFRNWLMTEEPLILERLRLTLTREERFSIH